MTLVKTQPQLPEQKRRFRSGFEILMALIVLFNYLLVVFDLIYIPTRDFWSQGKLQVTLLKFNYPVKVGAFNLEEIKIPPDKPLEIPFVTAFSGYDAIKGIVPYRSTNAYLEKVDELTEQFTENNLQFSQTKNQKNIDSILADLREQSIEIIDTNPFQIANKTGALEKIKNDMRNHVFDTKDASSKEAFKVFWSRENLEQKGFEQELSFFNQKLRPFIETNYFRPIGEDGKAVDNFNAIDFFFWLIFLPEFLIRTWRISRQNSGVSWFDAMLWRWYDIFLLIPFFRWLRIIPVVVRLNQSGLINLSRVQRQTSKGLVTELGEDITEVVVLKVLNQLKELVRQGGLRQFLSQLNTKQYIDINNIDEVAEIVRVVARVMVDNVLPQIKPDAEAFLQYNLEKTISQTSAYQSLQQLPGMKKLQSQLSDRLATQIYQNLTKTVDNLTKEDPQFNKLLGRLTSHFNQVLKTELKTQNSMDKIEFLLEELLEEIKINYAISVYKENVGIVLEQTRELRKQS